MEDIRRQISESIRVKELLLADEALLKLIKEAAETCITALRSGKKIMFAGNGGSAADAQHIAAELVNRFLFDRPGIAGLALTTDSSVITAIGNDYSFDILFSRQIESLGTRGDVFVALSTSGNSINVIKGIQAAKEKEIKTIGITRITGGEMAEHCDIVIKIPSEETPRVQDATILIGHIICNEIEKGLFSKK